MKITTIDLLLGLLSLSLFASIAQAQLVMTIDTTAETYTISGSDTVSPEYNSLRWMTDSSNTHSEQRWFNAGDAVTTSTGGSLTYRGGGFIFDISFANSDPQTATGTDVAISYASATSDFKTGMTNLIGASPTLVYGTVNQPLTFVGASAVPEPSTYAAICGLFTLMGTVMVRRRRRPAA